MGRIIVVVGGIFSLASGFLVWGQAESDKRQSPVGIPSDALVFRSIDWLPKLTAPRPLPIYFPRLEPVRSVEHLASAGGRLWIVAPSLTATNLPPGTGDLWSFSFVENQMLRVRGRIEGHQVSGLNVRPDALWLPVDGGVASLNPRTFVLDSFSATQGLTTETPVAFAEAASRLHVLADSGAAYSLGRDGRFWTRLPGLPHPDPRTPVRWERLAGAGDWLAASGAGQLSIRHALAPEWQPLRSVGRADLPFGEAPDWRVMVGDESGVFWMGSSLGLHELHSDNLGMNHHLVPMPTTVPGGLGMKVPVGFRATTNAVAQVTLRMAEGIRGRMRDRARIARQALELQRPLDFFTPKSRVPSGVTALTLDRSFLWIACSNGESSGSSRILLYHVEQKKWIGSFPLGLPVRSMVADDKYLWVGFDISGQRGAAPLAAIPKNPLLAIPSNRWRSERIEPEELFAKLSALPRKERAVLSFFANDAAQTVKLLEDPGIAIGSANESGPSDGDDNSDMSAEVLFLLAFAHDPVGLDDPVRYRTYLHRLHSLYPESPFAVATRALVDGPVIPNPTLPGVSASSRSGSAGSTGATSRAIEPALRELPVEVTVPTISPAESAPQAETVPAAPGRVEVVLARRDLDRDGSLNLLEVRIWLGSEVTLDPFDANNDGRLDRDEIEALLDALGIE